MVNFSVEEEEEEENNFHCYQVIIIIIIIIIQQMPKTTISNETTSKKHSCCINNMNIKLKRDDNIWMTYTHIYINTLTHKQTTKFLLIVNVDFRLE